MKRDRRDFTARTPARVAAGLMLTLAVTLGLVSGATGTVRSLATVKLSGAVRARYTITSHSLCAARAHGLRKGVFLLSRGGPAGPGLDVLPDNRLNPNESAPGSYNLAHSKSIEVQLYEGMHTWLAGLGNTGNGSIQDFGSGHVRFTRGFVSGTVSATLIGVDGAHGTVVASARWNCRG